jgi:hypothetical protein
MIKVKSIKNYILTQYIFLINKTLIVKKNAITLIIMSLRQMSLD